MHEQEYALVKALVPVAWADGVFADKEKETIEAFLTAYRASDDEKREILDYAKEKRTLEDINLQDLSAGDRRVLLQHAVLVTFVDGEQHPDEVQFLKDLASKLRIPDDEAKEAIAQASLRAKEHIGDLS